MAVGLTAKIVLLASIGGCAASRRAGRVVLGHADKQEEPEITPMEGAFTTSKYDYDPRPGGEYKDTENIIEMLKTAAYMNPEKLVFRTPRQDETGALVPHGRMAGSKYSYRYFKTNWTEYHEKAMDAATAFVSLGLQPMDTCHIKGINSPEWLMAYMGCIAAGGVPVGLYDQDSPKTLLHKAKDSGANFVILGSAVDLDVYAEFLDEIPTAKHFILWDGGRQREALLPSTTEIFWKAERQLLHWDTFLQLGDSNTVDNFRDTAMERIDTIKPGQVATIVYTSGTRGKPKGVMLSHDAMTWAAKKLASVIQTAPHVSEHHVFSYLPLNEALGQLIYIITPLYLSMTRESSVSLMFPSKCFVRETCDLEQMKDSHSTLFFGTPAMWDGLLQGVRMKHNESWIKKNPGKVLKSIGMQDVVYATSGGATMAETTLEVYHQLGLEILSSYARSETSGLGTVWWPHFYAKYHDLPDKWGSVGRPLGNDARIFDPDTEGSGEIHFKGRNIMLGYLNDAQGTRNAITEDGWLKTDDTGRIDRDHFVFLDSLTEDTMKSYAGEWIHPVAVEMGIETSCNQDGKIMSRAIVQGDGWHYLSVLVTLVEHEVDGVPDGQLKGAARDVDPEMDPMTVVSATNSGTWKATIAKCIQDYNDVAMSSAETVWRFAILPHELTLQGSPDVMIANDKINRAAVSYMYQDLIDGCGGDPAEGAPGDLHGVQPCAGLSSTGIGGPSS